MRPFLCFPWEEVMSEHSEGNPFGGPQMKGSHHQRADLSGAYFDGCNLDSARFYAVMTKARFTDTDLSAADFDDVNLAESRFHNVNLSGAAITNANLSRLTISGVTLAHTTIEDADVTGLRINGVLVADLFAAYEQAIS
jgi:uncharacterized protein YjbI with pentapeptide repeats